MEQVHKYKNDGCLQYAGANTAAQKFPQLRQYHLCRPIVTLKHKGLVGQKREGDRCNPGDGIAHRAGKMEQIETGQIHKVVYHRCQTAKKEVGKDIVMLADKIFNQSPSSSPTRMNTILPAGRQWRVTTM